MSVRRVGQSLVTLVVALVGVMALAACAGIPVDPDGTLDRASGGILRVGMSDEPPWSAVDDGERVGVEVDLVEEFTRDRRANEAGAKKPSSWNALPTAGVIGQSETRSGPVPAYGVGVAGRF